MSKKLTEGVIELKPIYNRLKSFYHKAYVIKHGDDVYLKSYSTIVCGIVNGKFERYWEGETITTLNHVDSFVSLYSISYPDIPSRMGVAEWRKYDVIKLDNDIQVYLYSKITPKYKATYY